ncbi:MAG: Mu transposase C-terminal domain-containing protein [Alicyclobacillaceae bacterium]|nr:Mu transposase C-terminal domain-containing protein [Alicyclobacillaceae bacterium]
MTGHYQEASVLTPYMPDGSYENLRVKLLPFENRTIQKDGIHWEGLTYQSHELWKYGIQLPDGKSVSFKYDPGDIGKIHVYNASSDSYMIVPCTQSDQVDGRSLYVHRVIRGELAKIRMKADRQSMIKVTANTVEKIKTEEAKKDKVSRRTVKIRGIGNNQSDNQIELLEKSIALVSVKSNRKRLDDDKVNTWGTKIDDTI